MGESAYQERKWYDASVSGPLSSEQLEEFLAGRWLLKLALTKSDGWPFVVPLWYQWEQGAFWLVGRKRSAWIQDLVRDPRCAACVEEKEIPPDGGNRKVLAQCTAEVVEGPVVAEGSAWVEVAQRMALRYVGPEGPEALSRSYGWERYLVKLSPRDGELTTFQGVDWHRRYFDPGQRPDLEEKARAAAERRTSSA
ncbi:MAG: pyridoxamine 5'-phosphate oxidase family protein [Gaiellales bacterium]